MKSKPRLLGRCFAAVTAFAVGFFTTPATAQARANAIFVANNGNLEGSVTAFRVESEGTPEFRNRIVTGTRTSTTQPCSGCNAYTIDITPDGRFIATGHAAGDPPLPDGLTVFSIADDARITQVVHVQLSNLGSPLNVRWVNNEFLAVTRTSSPSNGAALYRFNPDAVGGPTLTNVDFDAAGGFSTALAVHPSGQYVFMQNTSGGSGVFTFAFNGSTLAPVGFLATSGYPLGIGVSPNGLWLYGGGGISGGSHNINGLAIDPASGALSTIPGSPFFSAGNSPKQVAVSGDNLLAFAAHGSDSTVHSFSIDPATGALASTGFSVDIGVQGSLGEVEPLGNVLYALDRDTITDGVRGVRMYAIGGDGSMTAFGGVVSTQGIGPNELAVWNGPDTIPADINQDGVVDGLDLGILLALWGHIGITAADFNQDGIVDGLDLGILLASWTL